MRFKSKTHPGQPFSLMHIVSEREQFIGEVDPENPSLEFIQKTVNALVLNDKCA